MCVLVQKFLHKMLAISEVYVWAQKILSCIRFVFIHSVNKYMLFHSVVCNAWNVVLRPDEPKIYVFNKFFFSPFVFLSALLFHHSFVIFFCFRCILNLISFFFTPARFTHLYTFIVVYPIILFYPSPKQ